MDSEKEPEKDPEVNEEDHTVETEPPKVRPKNALDRLYFDYKEKVARSNEQKKNSKALQQMSKDIEAGKKAAT